MLMNRRQAIKTATAGVAAAAVIQYSIPSAFSADKPVPAGEGSPFKLSPLPYDFDALEPHIDAKTMEIHYGKHHATYVKNLNAAVADHPGLAKMKLEDLIRTWESLPEPVKMSVRNNGGGHLNHSLFWQMMSPKGGGKPKGNLAAALDKKFGSFDGFQKEFTLAATKVFGSGWAWLSMNNKKELVVESTPNQDNPIAHGNIPLLGLDVWEHAYYLKNQNRRVDYISSFFNVIHWDFVATQFEAAGK